VREDGSEVTTYDEPGEIYAQSPGVILGYLDDTAGTSETFLEREDGRWLRTGDMAVVRRALSGNEHFFIVDRVKEVLKVKVRYEYPSPGHYRDSRTDRPQIGISGRSSRVGELSAWSSRRC